MWYTRRESMSEQMAREDEEEQQQEERGACFELQLIRE